MQTTYVQKDDLAQRNADKSAASVLDASSQSESLQRKADMVNNAAQRAEAPRPNNTGLPDNLKSGIESLSGQSSSQKKFQSTSSRRIIKVGVSYRTDGNGRTAVSYDWAAIEAVNALFSPEDNIRVVPVPLPRDIKLEKDKKNNWVGPNEIKRKFNESDLDDIDMIYIPGNPHALDEQIDLNAEEYEEDPVTFTSQITHRFDFESASSQLTEQKRELESTINDLKSNEELKKLKKKHQDLGEKIGKVYKKKENKEKKDSEAKKLKEDREKILMEIKQKEEYLEIPVYEKKKEEIDELKEKLKSFPRRNIEYKDRADYEQKLVQFARNHGIPVLGVCGGSWQLYRNYGGTTVLLGPEQYKKHAQGISNNEAHLVTAKQETMLAGIMKTNPIRVNSTHWASVKPGEDGNEQEKELKEMIDISSYETSSDAQGSPEAFETKYGVPMMGIQWHPETFLPGMPGYESFLYDFLGFENIFELFDFVKSFTEDGQNGNSSLDAENTVISSHEIFKFFIETAITRQKKREFLKSVGNSENSIRRIPSRNLFQQNNCLPVAILGRTLADEEAERLRSTLEDAGYGRVGDFLYDDLEVIRIIVQELNVPDQIIEFRDQNETVQSRYVVLNGEVTIHGPGENIALADNLSTVVILNIANYHFERVCRLDPSFPLTSEKMCLKKR